VVLSAAVAVLPACLSETPIVPGAPAPLDERLVGVWRCVSPEEGEDATITLTVRRKDGTSYAGTMGESADKTSPFEAHLVGPRERTLVNVKETETDSAEKWTVVRHAFLRPDVLHLDMLDSDAFRAGPKEAAAALQDPKRRELLLRDWCTCVRVRSGS
jgi:hypothetical protein